MTGIAEDITEAIGNTPLIRLRRFEEEAAFSGRILAKIESFNPGGSVKDRIAREMIRDAEKRGTLKKGGTIVEATSGNTGIGIAAICAALGYHAVIVMPDNASNERIKILKAFGAEVVLTPAEKMMGGAGEKAAEILEATENAIILNQGANDANPQAHYRTTGPEIWEAAGGKVDLLVATVGTGGTISGTGRYLKKQNPALSVIGVEPAECAVLSGGEPGLHKIQGIGGGKIAQVTDLSLLDEIIVVTDEDAYQTTRAIAAREGILSGISGGAALWAVLQLAKRPENAGKTIVTVFPDSLERYLSTDLLP